MKSQGTLIALAAWLIIGTGQAQARPSRQASDHLSYYKYYKTGNRETVSSVASRFGLAASSLIKMNPVLAQYESGVLPKGLSVCVPKPKPKVTVTQAESEKPQEKKLTKRSKSKKKKRKRRRKKKQRVEPTEKEWEYLAKLATEDAPEVKTRPKPRPPTPKSKFVGTDGRVVWVPAAKPKPKPVSKKTKKKRRNRLRSKKGKAIYEVLMTCRSFMGVPYVWGGEQPSGFDCSGYIQYVYGKHGYKLPRTADIQFNVGEVVKRGKELPGDLVFFETYAPGASHVGVYLGRGYFIHASSSRGITVEKLSTPFFAQRYLGARRNI